MIWFFRDPLDTPLEDWTPRRAEKWAEWTQDYLEGSCGPVTVIPAWQVDRERRASQMAMPSIRAKVVRMRP